MTEEQMRKRMKEIDNELNRLSEERKQYENYFSSKNTDRILDLRRKCIGKCYASKGIETNTHDDIEAFKIIEVLDSPNENYALCVVLINGNERSFWDEYGVVIKVLGIWTDNKPSMRHIESSPKMINYYNEISQEEFENLCNRYLGNIEDKIKV